MTVEYSAGPDNGFVSALFRWKGSVYKLVWVRILVFLLIYFAITLVFRYILREHEQKVLLDIANYFEAGSTKIPVTFLIGFYVNFMVHRWWEQYNLIMFPDQLLLNVLSIIRGTDEESKIIRRTIARWANLMAILTWRIVSIRIRKRLPTAKHLLDAGLVTESELTEILSPAASNGKYFFPAIWCINLLGDLKAKGTIDSYERSLLVGEVNAIREQCGKVLSYNWVNIPLVYTQVATLAIYGYFTFVIIGRQPSESFQEKPVLDEQGKPHRVVDLYFPFVTMLEFVFYMGWLAVAEQLYTPWGESDEDFELNWVLDRNVKVGFVIADHGDSMRGEVTRDAYWNWNFNHDDLIVPHTIASAKITGGEPQAKFHQYRLPRRDMKRATFGVPKARAAARHNSLEPMSRRYRRRNQPLDITQQSAANDVSSTSAIHNV